MLYTKRYILGSSEFVLQLADYVNPLKSLTTKLNEFYKEGEHKTLVNPRKGDFADGARRVY